jgi:hypothetical protein
VYGSQLLPPMEAVAIVDRRTTFEIPVTVETDGFCNSVSAVLRK